MAKNIKVGDVTHSFPDEATDAEIQETLNAAHPETHTDPRAKLGQYVADTVSNIPASAGKMASGLYQAVRHPIDTANAAATAISGLSQKYLPSTHKENVPVADALGSMVKERYGSLPAIANTIKTDPVGVAADVSTVAGGVGGLTRGLGRVAATRAPGVASGLLRVADTASAVSDATNPLKLAGAAVSKVPVPERLTPRGLYQSALRPGLSRKNLPKVGAEVDTGIREGIPVDSGGLDKLNSTLDDVNGQIKSGIAERSDELGPVVKPLDVTKPVNRLKRDYGKGGRLDQVNPEGDLNEVNSVKAQYLRKHTTEAPYTKIAPMVEEGEGFTPVGEGVTKTKQPYTLSEAQAEKQGTYKQLRDKYGKLGSAEIEAQKALAMGLKDEIAKRVPGISELNARDGALLDLQRELERMVVREGNKNLLGLVPSVMSHNPYGFLATLAMDNPAIKSRIAIALDRAKKLQGPASKAAGIATPASAVGSGVNSLNQKLYGKE